MIGFHKRKKKMAASKQRRFRTSLRSRESSLLCLSAIMSWWRRLAKSEKSLLSSLQQNTPLLFELSLCLSRAFRSFVCKNGSNKAFFAPRLRRGCCCGSAGSSTSLLLLLRLRLLLRAERSASQAVDHDWSPRLCRLLLQLYDLRLLDCQLAAAAATATAATRLLGCGRRQLECTRHSAQNPSLF